MQKSGPGFAGRSLLAGDPAFAKIDQQVSPIPLLS
jgi:hypothetical protein